MRSGQKFLMEYEVGGTRRTVISKEVENLNTLTVDGKFHHFFINLTWETMEKLEFGFILKSREGVWFRRFHSTKEQYPVGRIGTCEHQGWND